MAQTATDGSYPIIKAMVGDLIADFDYTNVHGLSQNPIFTDTVTDRTPEPYVYIYETSSSEEWVSKTSESRLYDIMIQVVVRNTPGRGNPEQRDDIVNEVIRLVSDQTDFPDASGDGFRIQRITTGEIIKYATNERGAKFWIANLPVEVTAYYHGYDASVLPVATPIYTYAGWGFTPANNNIEKYDNGSITVGNTYSDSNGWNYESSTVTQTVGRTDGTLSGRVLTVGDNDESLGLTVRFDWTLISDNTQTTSTSASTRFERIQSVRYGAIASDSAPVFLDNTDNDVGLQRLVNFTRDRQSIDFNNVSPIGDTFEITSNAGEWIYIMYGSNQQNISGITEDAGGQDLLDLFEDPVIVGDWKIYIFKQATNYDNSVYTYSIT